MTDIEVGESSAARRLAQAARTGELRLAPPLAIDDLASFEQSHGIELPSEYRWFVTRLGNGGEGPPYYGVEPLSDRLIEATSVGDPDTNRNHRLAEPFPARATTQSDLDEDHELDWAAYEAGRLLLGTDGCAILWVLVVSGHARGQVWRLEDDTALPAEPSGLLDWYLAWLDDRPPPKPHDPTPIALRSETGSAAVLPFDTWKGNALGGWWSRVFATMLDIVASSFVCAVLLGIAAALQAAGAPKAAYIPFSASGFLSLWLLPAITMVVTNGQSPGKMATHLRVVRTNGKPTNLPWSILREWPVKAILFVLIPFLDYLWPLWDRENRALHDMAVRSRVVRTDITPRELG
jgi:uncharacterized RDD family membrane protein YckC